tara:strand:+ start:432 stop:2195 length:1764 start_codon:yes stop_codon:yes gene_type:complete
MKLKNLDKWTDTKKLESLLFFSQRIDELAFQYTLDSYKPPCLNPVYLVEEALSIVEEVENDVIDPASLKPIIDELEWAIQKDIASKELIELSVRDYLPNIENSKLKDVRIKLELLQKRLQPMAYLIKCTKMLEAAIANSEKRNIDALLQKLMSTLINMGVSKKHIHETVNKVFFEQQDTEIDSNKYINSFYEAITPKIETYNVCFSVSKLAKFLSDVSGIFGLEIIDKAEEFSGLFGNDVIFPCKESDIYVIARGVEAYDKHSAILKAEANLEKVANLYSLFHHKQKIGWKKQVVIAKHKTVDSEVIDIQNNPIENGFDLRPNKAARKLNEVLKNFTMSSEASFFKFDSVVDLHGLAARSDTRESQLLNIWISLETLTPPNSSVSKIKNITSSITPFMVLNYTTRFIQRIKGDLFNWDRAAYKEILRKVEVEDAQGAYYKVAKFIMLDDQEDLRRYIYNQLDAFPLLRYRIFNLHKIFSKPENVISLIDEHRKKIEWQIRRLYRTRNLIVHSGKSPDYIGTLVENGHDYLDQIMNEIMIMCSHTKEASTLEQAYKLVDMKSNEYVKTLSSADSFNDSNYLTAFREWS